MSVLDSLFGNANTKYVKKVSPVIELKPGADQGLAGSGKTYDDGMNRQRSPPWAGKLVRRFSMKRRIWRKSAAVMDWDSLTSAASSA